ncbi:MAG: hypothetical protein ACUVX8_16430 [Candidatus Zipacnadales bacterium]
MTTRLKIAALGALGVGLGLWGIWRLLPDRRTDSQQILDALLDIQQAVCDKNVRGCMKYVSDAYQDSTAENKRELIRLAHAGFGHRGDFYCLLQAQRPQVNNGRATVEVIVDFRVDRGGQVNRVKPFLVHTEWVKERRGWRIIRAEGYMRADEALDDGYW